jgi:glycosyltransferase involved in cell wall biosynthesis
MSSGSSQKSPSHTEKISVVAGIPAYNEERAIAGVVIEAQKYVDEVIVCDDGSDDLTGEIASRLGARVIRHAKNMGKGEALRSLFLACRELDVDALVTLDGDAQHSPSEITSLLEFLQKGSADVVIGARFGTSANRIPAHRRLGNKMLNRVTTPTVSDTQSGFRAYSRRAISSILPSEMGMGVDSEILMEANRLGLKIVEVPASVRYGIGKTSTHNPVYHTFDVLLSVLKLTSLRHPLLFYGVPGLAAMTAGVYYAFHALVLFSRQQIITNVTMTYELIGISLTLFGLLAFFTGIILFTLTSVVRREI